MKTGMKRIFSMLLALVMVFSLTVPAFADDAVCTCQAGEGAEHAADCAITLAAQQQPDTNTCTGAEGCTAAEHNSACPSYVKPCTGAEDCGADSHNEGCLSQKQPEPAAAVCTMDDSCTLAEGHSEGCPKAETKQPEQPPVDALTCTKAADCPAAEHEAECLKAAADKAAADAAAAEAQKAADIAAVQAMLNALTAQSSPEELYAVEAAIQNLVDTYGIVPEEALVLDNLYLNDNVPTENVASVDGVGYPTLAEAINAAAADKTVTLLKSVTLADKETLSLVGITLDLNTNTLTINGESGTLDNATIKNGNVVITTFTGDTVADGIFNVVNGSSKVDNVKFSSTDCKMLVIFDVLENSTISISNSSFDISIPQYIADSNIGIITCNNGKGTSSMEMDNCTVTASNIDQFFYGGAATIKNSTINLSNNGNGINNCALTLDNTSFTVTGANGRGLTSYDQTINIIKGSTVNISGCKEANIAFKDCKADASIIVDDTSTIVKTSIQKISCADGTEASVVVNGISTVIDTPDTPIEVASGSIKYGYPTVAMIGSDKFSSLKAAVEAANINGGEIELVDNITMDEKLSITSNVSITGAYTITRDDAYTGTFFDVAAGASLKLDGGIIIDGGNNYSFNTAAYDSALQNHSTGTSWGDYASSEAGAPVMAAPMFKINGSVSTGSITIQNSFANRDSNSGGYSIFQVNGGASLNTTGTTIKHVATGGANSVAYVGANASWTIGAGTSITDTFAGGNGGICRTDSGSVIMNGGEIRNNRSYNTNGTFIMMYKGSFTMNDGIICSNSGISGGSNGRCAVIYGHSSSTFVMNNGEICHNTGISYGGVDTPSSIKAEINGGYIGENVSILGNTNADVNGNANTIINGGKFTQDVGQWLAPDCGLEYDPDTGIYKVIDADDAKNYEYNGSTYASLKAVIADIKKANDSNASVKVLMNNNLAEEVVLDVDMNLDLNGKKIAAGANFNDEPLFRIVDGKTLNISDGVGKGSVNSSKTGYCFTLGSSDVKSAGYLNITGGTFHGATSAVSVTMGELNISGGKFSVDPYNGNYNFLLNCYDPSFRNGSAKINVSGGSFEKFDPANNAAEGAGTNFVTADKASYESSSDVFTVVDATVAIKDGANYASLQDAIDAAKDNDTVILLKPITISNPDGVIVDGAKQLTLDLAGYAITCDEGVYPAIRVQGDAELTVTGSGSITNAKDYVFVLGSSDKSSAGTLNIENGSFTGGDSSVLSVTKGTANISGGHFVLNNDDKTFLLNCFDESYNNKTAKIVVTGGTFEGFDPNNNEAETGNNTNFVAPGKGSYIDANGNYAICDAVASTIGNDYGSLASAITVACSQNPISTVELLKPIELSEAQAISAAMTIDAKNNAITKADTLVNAFSIPEGVTLTITNWPGDKAALEALAPGYLVAEVAGAAGTFTITGRSGFAVVSSAGTTVYNTLAEAISKASDGDTVIMYQNENTDSTIVIGKAITIEGAKNGVGDYPSINYRGSGEDARAINVNCDGDVTIKNLTINAEKAQRAINVIQKAVNLTLENVTATASNYTICVADSADQSGDTVNLTVNGGEYTGLNTLNVGANSNVLLNGTTIKTIDNSAKEDYSTVAINLTGGSSKVSATNGTKILYTHNVTNEEDVDGACSVSITSNGNAGFTQDGSCTLTYPNVITNVAIIEYGDNYYAFPTLGEAISYAISKAQNDVPVLLRDVELTETVNVTANITVDLNGNSISKASGLASAFSLGEGVVLTLDFDEDQTAPMSMDEVKALVPGLCVTEGSFIIKAHDFKYENIEGENKITQTCNNGCDHKAIALIDYKDAKKTSAPYTGAEITNILELSFVAADSSKGISSWAGAAPVLSHKDNIDPGTATGSISIGGVSASKTFEIVPAELKSEANSKFYRDSGKSLKFTIETDGKYFPGSVSYVGIYNSAKKLVATVPQSSLNAYLDSDKDIVITVPASVMAKLGTGRYTMKAELVSLTAAPDDGDKVVFTAYTSCEFRVRYPVIIPSTGDPANFLLWGGLLLAATAALGGTVIVLKKSKKQK